jgi:hypothetical protein
MLLFYVDTVQSRSGEFELAYHDEIPETLSKPT